MALHHTDRILNFTSPEKLMSPSNLFNLTRKIGFFEIFAFLYLHRMAEGLKSRGLHDKKKNYASSHSFLRTGAGNARRYSMSFSKR